MNTPDHCSDDTINELWEGGPALPSVLNPETMFHGARSYVIDLRRKYAFEYRMIGTFRRTQWECVDVLTFDPDPDSRWHCIGYGKTQGEAQGDLLEKIAYAVAHE